MEEQHSDMEEKEYDYAHRNTETDVRRGRTSQFNKYRGSASFITDYIEKLRKDCAAREIPVSSEETLCAVCTIARMKGAKNILELGTATGVSGMALADAVYPAKLTTIECREDFLAEAEQNFRNMGIDKMVRTILGDAGEEIKKLQTAGCTYDFIFMDCAKVQYVKYLPILKDLLEPNGVLVADDVLIYGWATGEAEVPAKRHMLAQHIREYIDAVLSDDELYTVILDVGDGMAVSVKK